MKKYSLALIVVIVHSITPSGTFSHNVGHSSKPLICPSAPHAQQHAHNVSDENMIKFSSLWSSCDNKSRLFNEGDE